MDIKEEKQQLRKKILSLLRAQAPGDLAKKSELIFNKLTEIDILKQISCVMVYVSYQYEVDTHALINALLRGGKKIVIPFLNAEKDIIPYEIFDLGKDTETSRYGYLEPIKQRRMNPCAPDELDVVIVPGVAFDADCNRLGRGWGCYDRFISKNGLHKKTIGLAFDIQMVPSIPALGYDVPVSRVITN